MLIFIKSYRSLSRAVIITAALLVPAHTALVYVTPSETMIPNAGGFGTVDIMVTDLEITDDVSGFDLDISFDPLGLALDSCTLSDALGMMNIDAIDVSNSSRPAGIVNIAAVSLFSDPDADFADQPGTFRLASLAFRGLVPRSSSIGIKGMLSDGWGMDLVFTAQSGKVTVPEPAILSMMLFGISGLSFFRRKKQLA